MNLFSSSEFDNWADTYNSSVLIDQFPFHGYRDVLAKIVSLAAPGPGHAILDLGTGTGNLATLFSKMGCDLWCTDFSAPMLEKARLKLPTARFIQHDLCQPLSLELTGPFDRIVSAYVFHHFELDKKISILRDLLLHLVSGGRIIIGDIAFPDAATWDRVKTESGDGWEEEFYWLADESLSVLQKAGIHAGFTQVSAYAGVFVLNAM